MTGEHVTIRCPIEMDPPKGPEPEPGACLHNEETSAKVELEDDSTGEAVRLDLQGVAPRLVVVSVFDKLRTGIMISQPCVSAFRTTVTLPVSPGEVKHESWPGNAVCARCGVVITGPQVPAYDGTSAKLHVSCAERVFGGE